MNISKFPGLDARRRRPAFAAWLEGRGAAAGTTAPRRGAESKPPPAPMLMKGIILRAGALLSQLAASCRW